MLKLRLCQRFLLIPNVIRISSTLSYSSESGSKASKIIKDGPSLGDFIRSDQAQLLNHDISINQNVPYIPSNMFSVANKSGKFIHQFIVVVGGSKK